MPLPQTPLMDLVFTRLTEYGWTPGCSRNSRGHIDLLAAMLPADCFPPPLETESLDDLAYNASPVFRDRLLEFTGRIPNQYKPHPTISTSLLSNATITQLMSYLCTFNDEGPFQTLFPYMLGRPLSVANHNLIFGARQDLED